MNIVDIIILVIFVFFMYRNYQKGFLDVILSPLLAIILSAFCAIILYEPLTPVVDGFIKSPKISAIVSFFILLVVINYIINKLRELLRKLLEKLYLGSVNSILGAAIGFIKGFILVGILIWFWALVLDNTQVSLLKKEYKNSQMVSLYKKFLPLAIEAIPDGVKKKINETIPIQNKKK